MKKILVLLCCLSALLFISCSRTKSPQQQFIKVCQAYMQSAGELKTAIQTAHHNISHQGLNTVTDNLDRVITLYNDKIVTPFSNWQQACFGTSDTMNTSDCDKLVSAVQTPTCAQATAITYKTQIEKE